MISICMASFNGQDFILEQINSILFQLNDSDELIIVDDCSLDSTIAIIESINDSRIKLYRNITNQGVVGSFERAISLSLGEIVFLSDQDDIWVQEKVSRFMREFDSFECDVVMSDCVIVDKEDRVLYDSFFKYRNTSSNFLKNIYKNSYIGCNMAFRRKLIKYILPIPNNVNMHDQWIGLIGSANGSVRLIEEKLIRWRRHPATVTSFKRGSFYKVIKDRIVISINLIVRLFVLLKKYNGLR